MGKRGKAPSFTNVCCPNAKCERHGEIGKGNIVANGTYTGKSGNIREFICRHCGKVFNERIHTVFYYLRTSCWC